ncbi:RNA polymerase sigma-54 factor [Polymorphobacter glacialis]|uniref:RNA polymerase sigma-54 factor n=1 Tax=Sandarakinorhabdus glacialis TaxID=1614636 RepID=A0A916ZR52_9SPHN|nr:RNA polymerase factor sigma-54 [Polymorphobacter glacialis]GGE08901.1 RNA polymerase sigma-54 factor [Polymorphobacter glacialis]
MSLGPRLELRQSQQLVMTPQLQLAIKLLTLTNVELEAYIGEELDKNPLLSTSDGADTADAPVAAEAAPDASASGLDTLLGGGEGSAGSGDTPLDIDPSERFQHDTPGDSADWGAAPTGGDNDDLDFDSFAAADASLGEILAIQASAAFDGADLIIARHIIDLIDESGYLGEPTQDIAERLGVDISVVEAVLAGIHRFEPTGVGARNLAECIAIQARDADRYDPAMACLIANLDFVARGDIPGLMRICALDREDIADMIRELRRYDPKPGLRFGGDRAAPVVADVFVHRGDDGEWRIELNQATLPRLLIDRDYHAVLEAGADKSTTNFLNECVHSANWLLKALDQRARTIVRVAAELVKHQRGFFDHGVGQLKPLTLRSIAEAIDMHESTVSRVTSNKYIQCERGLFELRYFFTSGVGSSDGGEASSALAVKDRIARLIAAETHDTLSDDKLVEILQREGFDIARRTVAKYREALGLGSSVARRRARLLAAA